MRCERRDKAAVLVEAAEQRRDRRRGVHHRRDERGVPVDAWHGPQAGRAAARGDGREDEPGQLERRGERGDFAARCVAVGVGRVGARLADGAQRGGDAAVQLTGSLLDLGEGEGVEAFLRRGYRTGGRIVRGHGVL